MTGVPPEVPDALPEDLHEQTYGEFMLDLEVICRGSALRRGEILGALEAVKFNLLCSWVGEAAEDG